KRKREGKEEGESWSVVYSGQQRHCFIASLSGRESSVHHLPAHGLAAAGREGKYIHVHTHTKRSIKRVPTLHGTAEHDMASQQDSGFFEISIKSLLKSWSSSFPVLHSGNFL
ncbi:hypothetical protein AMELA_G00106380, partial [Ameiurus melas]